MSSGCLPRADNFPAVRVMATKSTDGKGEAYQIGNSTNIRWHEGAVSREAREGMIDQKASSLAPVLHARQNVSGCPQTSSPPAGAMCRPHTCAEGGAVPRPAFPPAGLRPLVHRPVRLWCAARNLSPRCPASGFRHPSPSNVLLSPFPVAATASSQASQRWRTRSSTPSTAPGSSPSSSTARRQPPPSAAAAGSCSCAAPPPF